jgi:hypothetical protein
MSDRISGRIARAGKAGEKQVILELSGKLKKSEWEELVSRIGKVIDVEYKNKVKLTEVGGTGGGGD